MSSNRPDLPELTAPERDLLVSGLLSWGGPARCTPEMAHALGHESLEAFDAFRERCWQSLHANQELSAPDRPLAIFATAVVFACDEVGAGIDWETCSGLSDEESIRTLRALQFKSNRLR